MEKTDRQTDKSTHWKSAIFDLDDNWTKLDNPPAGFKVYYQEEICPTTQKPHRQTHVDCGKQVRLSALTKWLKATKWIPVLGKQHIENSISYTSKKDTAVEGTHKEIQGEHYYKMEEILRLLAYNGIHVWDEWRTEENPWMEWKYLSGCLVEGDVKWANRLTNPAIKFAWKSWGPIFRFKLLEELEESVPFIIEEQTLEKVDFFSKCLIYDETPPATLSETQVC